MDILEVARQEIHQELPDPPLRVLRRSSQMSFEDCECDWPWCACPILKMEVIVPKKTKTRKLLEFLRRLAWKR